MSCLIMGCNFLLRHVPNEVFTIDYNTLEYDFKPIQTGNIFPYLLVNVGSGVSIVKVDILEKNNLKIKIYFNL